MEKGNKRSIRRAHNARMKAKALKACFIQNGPYLKYVVDCGSRRSVLQNYIKNANHLAACSCMDCGNPRDGNGRNDKTLQERKADDAAKC